MSLFLNSNIFSWQNIGGGGNFPPPLPPAPTAMNITHIEASVSLFAFVVLISQFLDNDMFLSKWIRECPFVQVRVLKKHPLL